MDVTSDVITDKYAGTCFTDINYLSLVIWPVHDASNKIISISTINHSLFSKHGGNITTKAIFTSARL